jgi:hypothetical protein
MLPKETEEKYFNAIKEELIKKQSDHLLSEFDK